MLEHSDEDLPPLRTRLFFSILLVMVILSRPEGCLKAVLGLGSFVGIWLRGGGLLRSFKAFLCQPLPACLPWAGCLPLALLLLSLSQHLLCQGLPRSILQSV